MQKKRALGVLTAKAVGFMGLMGLPTLALALTLDMSSWLPESHPVFEKGFKPWAEAVAEVTQGRVKINIRSYELGSSRVHHDLVANGVVDVGYGIYSEVRGRGFTRARIAEIGALGRTAELSSTAFWQVYTKELGADKEHGDAKLLSAFVQGPGVLFLRSGEVQSSMNLQGLSIFASGAYNAELVSHWNSQVSDLSMRPLAEQLYRGVANAAIVAPSSLYQAEVGDFISTAYTQRGGISNQGWFLVVNRQLWQRIQPRDRRAIERISGAELAKTIGQIWDSMSTAVYAQLRVGGVELEPLPSELNDDIWFFQKAFEARWYEAVASQGYNGKQALRQLRRLAKPKRVVVQPE